MDFALIQVRISTSSDLILTEHVLITASLVTISAPQKGSEKSAIIYGIILVKEKRPDLKSIEIFQKTEIIEKGYRNQSLVYVDYDCFETIPRMISNITVKDLVVGYTLALIEPKFAKKILEDCADTISSTLHGDISSLAIPEKAIGLFLMDGSPLPPLPGIETLSSEILNEKRKGYSFDAASNN